jgi:succinate dehydrogenase / fumarate reductase iron-sulfur subunit/fumarate reductase iron-sulfur subunit
VAERDATLTVVIARSEPGARREFSLPRAGAHVILDLLVGAAREDPSLYFRYSCRSGFCGSCTVLVDGLPALVCQVRVPAATSTVHLAPLGGFAVVRDLVVDPSPFTERWAAISPLIAPQPAAGDALPALLRRPLDPAGRAPVGESLDCISCGACFAACDLSAMDRAFLGPAALTRAMVTIADTRDQGRAERLVTVSGREGVEGCHGIGACSLVCPKGLDPARAIRRLRRWRITGLP